MLLLNNDDVAKVLDMPMCLAALDGVFHEMAAGEAVILVREETSPEDIHGMHAARGIVTARGGMTSHAAVVARGMGRPCVSGAGDIQIDEHAGRLGPTHEIEAPGREALRVAAAAPVGRKPRLVRAEVQQAEVSHAAPGKRLELVEVPLERVRALQNAEDWNGEALSNRDGQLVFDLGNGDRQAPDEGIAAEIVSVVRSLTWWHPGRKGAWRKNVVCVTSTELTLCNCPSPARCRRCDRLSGPGGVVASATW